MATKKTKPDAKPVKEVAPAQAKSSKPAKKTTKSKVQYPIITRGSHSTRTEYEDGSVEFVTHWDELVRDVNATLEHFEQSKRIEEAQTKGLVRGGKRRL